MEINRELSDESHLSMLTDAQRGLLRDTTTAQHGSINYRCQKCRMQFSDRQVRSATACPVCGSSDVQSIRNQAVRGNSPDQPFLTVERFMQQLERHPPDGDAMVAIVVRLVVCRLLLAGRIDPQQRLTADILGLLESELDYYRQKRSHAEKCLLFDLDSVRRFLESLNISQLSAEA